MMRMTKTILAAAALLLAAPSCSTMTSSADSFDWTHNLDQALASSQAQDKPIFAFLETKTCSICMQMKRTTFKDQELIGAIGDDYVWLRLDAEDDAQGRELAKRFRVFSFPGMLLLDSQGDEIDRLMGYMPAEEFRSSIVSLTTGPGSLRSLQARAQMNPQDPRAHFELAERRRQREEYSEAAMIYLKSVQLDPKNEGGKVDDGMYFLSLCLAMVNQPKESLQYLEALESRFPNTSLMADLLLLRGQLHQHLGNSSLARTSYRSYLDRFPNHGFAARVRGEMAKLGTVGALPMASSH